jgi:hypothetical protein
VDAASGSFSLAGTAANILKNSKIVGASGSFSLSGTDATILKNSIIAAGAGSFVITGTDISIIYSGSGSVILIYKGRVIAGLGSGIPKGRTICGI